MGAERLAFSGSKKHGFYLSSVKTGLAVLLISLAFVSCQQVISSDTPDTPETSHNTSTSSTTYTFYKSVSAKKLTVVDSSVTKTSTEKIDIYKKGSSYYHKVSNNSYNPVHSNTRSTYLGVSVSSYNHWSLKVSSSVEYYYYFNY